MSNKELNFVLEYLVNEGYSDSYCGASKILNVMTEDWLNSILESINDGPVDWGGMERRARESHAAAVAAKKQRRKEHDQQRKTAPTYITIDGGLPVVPGSGKQGKGFYNRGQFFTADQVKEIK